MYDIVVFSSQPLKKKGLQKILIMDSKHICNGLYDSNECIFQTITSNVGLYESILKLYPEYYHKYVYICKIHNFIHFCNLNSTDCLIDNFSQTEFKICQLTGLENRYTIKNINHGKTIYHHEEPKSKLKKQKKICLKQLDDLQKFCIPNAVQYHILISNLIKERNLDTETPREVYDSAINRTYEFFLKESNLDNWKANLEIIFSVFCDIFSVKKISRRKRAKSSKFRNNINFIISLERSGKPVAAKPLYEEEKYIQRRKLKLKILEGKQKRRRNGKSYCGQRKF